MGITYTEQDYRPTLRGLLPKGRAWNFEIGSTFLKLLNSFSVEMARVSNRALELFENVDPKTTTELLTDWERIVGLPTKCVGQLADTDDKRRLDVVSRLTAAGGSTDAYLKSIANAAGFNATVTSQKIALCGATFCGDLMSSTDNWAYTIVLTLDEQAQDNPIDTNRALCLIAELKPAHIYVFTNYQDTFALCGNAVCGDYIRTIY